MAKTKDASPAFLCFAKQVYSFSMELDPAEFAVHWRGCLWEWEYGPLPDNPKRRARILGISQEQLVEIWPGIEHHWTLTEAGWQSDYIADRREVRAKFLRKSALAGKASGRARRAKAYASKHGSRDSKTGPNQPSKGQVERPLSDTEKLRKRRSERRAARANQRSTTYEGSESDTKERRSKVGSSSPEPTSGSLFNEMLEQPKGEAEVPTDKSIDLASNVDPGTVSTVPHARTARATSAPRNGPGTAPEALQGGPGAARSVAEASHGGRNGHGPPRGAHASHAWCSPRPGFCVTKRLHEEFLGKSGKPAGELLRWYAETLAGYDGVAIGDDLYDFWRSHFRDWIGSVAPSMMRQDRQTAELERRAREAEAISRMGSWHDECRELHNGECESQHLHTFRKFKEQGDDES